MSSIDISIAPGADPVQAVANAILADGEAENGPTPTDEETVASDSDDESAQVTDEEIETKASDEDSPAKGRSQKLQKLIDTKYAGDEDKFVDGLFAQWNSGSQMHSEIKELKEQIQKLTAPKETPPEPVESADTQWLGQQITALETEKNRNEQVRNSIVLDVGKVDREIAKLEGKIEISEDIEKTRLEAQLNRSMAIREKLVDKYQGLEERFGKIDHDKREINRQLKQAQKEIEAERASVRQRETENLVIQKETLQTFFTHIESAAKDFKIPQEAHSHMANTVRGELVLYLESLGKDAPPIDLAEAVKARVSAYAKVMGLAKNGFAGMSREKAASQPDKSGKTSQMATKIPEPKTNSSGKLTYEQAKAHIDKYL